MRFWEYQRATDYYQQKAARLQPQQSAPTPAPVAQMPQPAPQPQPQAGSGALPAWATQPFAQPAPTPAPTNQFGLTQYTQPTPLEQQNLYGPQLVAQEQAVQQQMGYDPYNSWLNREGRLTLGSALMGLMNVGTQYVGVPLLGALTAAQAPGQQVDTSGGLADIYKQWQAIEHARAPVFDIPAGPLNINEKWISENFLADPFFWTGIGATAMAGKAATAGAKAAELGGEATEAGLKMLQQAARWKKAADVVQTAENITSPLSWPGTAGRGLRALSQGGGILQDLGEESAEQFARSGARIPNLTREALLTMPAAQRAMALGGIDEQLAASAPYALGGNLPLWAVNKMAESPALRTAADVAGRGLGALGFATTIQPRIAQAGVTGAMGLVQGLSGGIPKMLGREIPQELIDRLGPEAAEAAWRRAGLGQIVSSPFKAVGGSLVGELGDITGLDRLRARTAANQVGREALGAEAGAADLGALAPTPAEEERRLAAARAAGGFLWKNAKPQFKGMTVGIMPPDIDDGALTSDFANPLQKTRIKPYDWAWVDKKGNWATLDENGQRRELLTRGDEVTAGADAGEEIGRLKAEYEAKQQAQPKAAEAPAPGVAPAVGATAPEMGARETGEPSIKAWLEQNAYKGPTEFESRPYATLLARIERARDLAQYERVYQLAISALDSGLISEAEAQRLISKNTMYRGELDYLRGQVKPSAVPRPERGGMTEAEIADELGALGAGRPTEAPPAAVAPAAPAIEEPAVRPDEGVATIRAEIDALDAERAELERVIDVEPNSPQNAARYDRIDEIGVQIEQAITRLEVATASPQPPEMPFGAEEELARDPLSRLPTAEERLPEVMPEEGTRVLTPGQRVMRNEVLIRYGYDPATFTAEQGRELADRLMDEADTAYAKTAGAEILYDAAKDMKGFWGNVPGRGSYDEDYYRTLSTEEIMDAKRGPGIQRRQRKAAWDETKAEYGEAARVLLREAGYTDDDLKQTSGPQMLRLANELGSGAIARTPKGAKAEIDAVKPARRQEILDSAPENVRQVAELVAKYGPTALPGIEADQKAILAQYFGWMYKGEPTEPDAADVAAARIQLDTSAYKPAQATDEEIAASFAAPRVEQAPAPAPQVQASGAQPPVKPPEAPPVATTAPEPEAPTDKWAGIVWPVKPPYQVSEKDSPPEVTADGDYVLYHGAPLTTAKQIVASRQLLRDDTGRTGITTTIKDAAPYGRKSQDEDAAVLRLVVDGNWLKQQQLDREVGGHGINQWLIRSPSTEPTGARRKGTVGVPSDAIKDVQLVRVNGEAVEAEAPAPKPEAPTAKPPRSANTTYNTAAVLNGDVMTLTYKERSRNIRVDKWPSEYKEQLRTMRELFQGMTVPPDALADLRKRANSVLKKAATPPPAPPAAPQPAAPVAPPTPPAAAVPPTGTTGQPPLPGAGRVPPSTTPPTAGILPPAAPTAPRPQPVAAPTTGERVFADKKELSDAIAELSPSVRKSIGETAVKTRDLYTEMGPAQADAVVQRVLKYGDIGKLFEADDMGRAWVKRNGATARERVALDDVLQNPSQFDLSGKQEEVTRAFGPIYRDAMRVLKEYGVKTADRTQPDPDNPDLPPLEQFIARRTIGFYNPDTGKFDMFQQFPDGKIHPVMPASFQRRRFYNTKEEAIADGGVYMKPEEALRGYITQMYRKVGDVMMGEYLIKNLVPIHEKAQGADVEFRIPGLMGKGYDQHNKDVAIIEKALGMTGVDKFKVLGQLVAQANDIPRMMLATFDVSPALLQGQILLAYNPRVWLRSVGLGIANFFDKGKGWQQFMDAHKETVRKIANYGPQLGSVESSVGVQESGLLTGRKFQGDGVLKRATRKFGENYDRTLTASRVLMAESLMRDTMSEKEKYDVMSFINEMTGTVSYARTNATETQRVWENALLFSPRYTRATLALLSDVARGGIKGKLARQALGKWAAAGLLLYLAICKALGQEPNLDPREGGKWLTFEVAGNNIGIGGAVYSTLRTGGKMAAEVLTGQPGEAVATLRKYLLSRGSPITSTMYKFLMREDYIGKPLDTLPELTRDWLKTNMVPTWLQATLEQGAIGDPNAQKGEGTVAMLTGLTGLRSYPVSAATARNAAREEYAQEWYGKKYDDLSAVEKARINSEAPGMAEKVQAAQQVGIEHRNPYSMFWDDVANVRQKYEDEIALLTSQLENGQLSGNAYREAVQQRELLRAKVPEQLKQTAQYRGKVEDYAEEEPTTPVDRFINEYYDIPTKYTDPATGVGDAAKIVKERELLKQAYDTEVVDEAMAFINRNRSPEYVEAQKQWAEYQAIPQYLGMTRAQQDAANRASTTIRSWRRQNPYVSAAATKAAYARYDPEGYRLYVMSSKLANPARKRYFAAHPLLSKYYGDVEGEVLEANPYA